MSNAAILFEPDGYVLSGPKLMGRQAAGNAFLRAAVAGRGDGGMYAYTPKRSSAEVFGQLVRELDPTASSRWVPAERLDLLAELGTLYLPGPGLDVASRLRLRAGAGAYSLVGVTHTTASHGAMDSIIGMLSAPVMPWDALICTSSSVVSTVQILLQAEAEHLRWRFGSDVKLTAPQLPVIPLGVHCADFEFTEHERSNARQALGIDPGQIVVLYVGRLSFHAKAHPYAMYAGLQAAVQRCGKSVTLLQCGWAPNDAVSDRFSDGAVQFCPDVQSLFADGRDAAVRRQCWAAADLFISLSDNIQETFGLTPIEAMAAGLPVVVTDWDGYKDTVRDGIDGFRIPTWMPPPNLGAHLARDHEAGIHTYDYYCGLTCQTVAVDIAVLAERLGDLLSSPALRQRLGANGRARARLSFDWRVVYGQYQSLWTELGAIRKRAVADPTQLARLRAAPAQTPGRLDPYRAFGHYPSALIAPDTLVQVIVGADLEGYRRLQDHGLFSYAAKILPSENVVTALLSILSNVPMRIDEVATAAGLDLGVVVVALSVLAKMGLVRLQMADVIHPASVDW